MRSYPGPQSAILDRFVADLNAERLKKAVTVFLAQNPDTDQLLAATAAVARQFHSKRLARSVRNLMDKLWAAQALKEVHPSISIENASVVYGEREDMLDAALEMTSSSDLDIKGAGAHALLQWGRKEEALRAAHSLMEASDVRGRLLVACAQAALRQFDDAISTLEQLPEENDLAALAFAVCVHWSGRTELHTKALMLLAKVPRSYELRFTYQALLIRKGPAKPLLRLLLIAFPAIRWATAWRSPINALIREIDRRTNDLASDGMKGAHMKLIPEG
jgi:hypothetical protein